MEDRDILKKIQQQDVEAYTLLIQNYSRYVSAIVIKISNNQLSGCDVEEISADVFVKLWENSHRIVVQGESIRAYIGVVTRNLTLNRLRGKNKEIHHELEDDKILIQCQTPEEVIISTETQEIINKTIRTIGEPDREIFIRRYFYLEKISEIAERLQINEKTVGVKLFRTKKKLENLLVNEGVM